MFVDTAERQSSGLRGSLARTVITGVILLFAAGSSALRAQDTWSPVAGPIPQNLWGVAWGAGSFVAVGEAGTIMTSPDGITWTARASGTTNWLTNVAFLNGIFIAVGERGTILVSTDGMAWTSRPVNTTRRLNAVAYGNGAYFAIAEEAATLMSADAVTWGEGPTLFRARGLTFAHGNFVVTGDRGQIATVRSSASLTRRELGTAAFIEGVAFGRRTFVAVGEAGFVATSPSGEEWIHRDSGTTSRLRGVTFFNGEFVAVGEGGVILSSPDGITWTRRNIGAAPLFTAVAVSDTIAVAVGHAGALYRSALSSRAPVIHTGPANVTEAVGSNVLFSVVATGRTPIRYQWSFNSLPIAGANADTLLLQNVQPSLAGRYSVTVIDVFDSVAVADGSLTVISAWPAPTPIVDQTFTALPAPTSAPQAALEQPDGRIIIGGNFVYLVNGVAQAGIARLNSNGSLDATFAAGSGVDGNGVVNALALQPDGRVIVGGAFDSVARTPRQNIARLLGNGALDTSFTPQAVQPVRDIVVQPDGKILLVAVNSNRLVRLNANGSLDSSFDAELPGQITRVALQSTGRIVVSGAAFPGGYVVRLHADGVRDTSFNEISLDVPVLALRVISGDRIVVAGQFVVTSGAWLIERFNSDGTHDPTFPTRTGSLNRQSMAFAIDAEGRVSTYTTPGSFSAPGTPGTFQRYTAGGAIDPTLRMTSAVTPGLQPTLVAISGGRLLILGSFTAIDGVARTGIARTVAANPLTIHPPVIASTSPQITRVRAGDSASLNVIAAGSEPLTYTWNAFNSPPDTPSTDRTTLTLTNIQQSALYSVTVSNPAGAISSQTFLVLVEASAPVLATPAADLSINTGRVAVLAPDIRGSEPRTYQWFFNDAPVGTGQPTLTINNVTAANAGVYTLVVRNALGTLTVPMRLTVDDTSRLIDIATRGRAGIGGDTMIAGFVLAGPVPKNVLVRGIGPGLSQFALTGLLPNPHLTVYNSSGEKVAENDNWGDQNSGVSIVEFEQAGAFPLPLGSPDAALVRQLPPGAYTVHLTGLPTGTGGAGTTGLALVEVYELDLQPTRLINLSTRLRVTPDAGTAIAGIVITGPVPRRVLVRAVGSALGSFGVPDALADPRLEITTASGTVVATNDNWATNSNASDIVAMSARVGAFPLESTSRDAAVLLTVPPGNYTALVSGMSTTSGVALVEVYEVP